MENLTVRTLGLGAPDPWPCAHMMCLDPTFWFGALRQVRRATTSCFSWARGYCYAENSGSSLSGLSTHEAAVNALLPASLFCPCRIAFLRDTGEIWRKFVVVREGRVCCGVIPCSLDRCKIYNIPERTSLSLAATTEFEIYARLEAFGNLFIFAFLSLVFIFPCVHPSSAPTQ